MAVAVDLGSAAVKVATEVDVFVLPPDPVGRELPVRVGTTVPVIRRHGDHVATQTPHAAYVRAAAAALDGTATDLVRVVTPDWWTRRAREVVLQTFTEHAKGPVELVSTAESGVLASLVRQRLPGTVAVLDIGAESSSAAIVHEVDGVRRLVGRPAVLHGRAGHDIDRRLMQHVLGWLRAEGHEIDPTDPQCAAAGRTLLGQVRAVKEELSSRPAATVRPNLPAATTELRLVRSELDEVARGTIDAVVTMLRSTMAQHDDEVGAVLLMGGSVSMPLVTQVVSAEVGLPVVLDVDPATLAARGAAAMPTPEPPPRRRWGRRRSGTGPVAVLDLDHAPAPDLERHLVAEPPPPVAPAPPAPAPPTPPPPPRPEPPPVVATEPVQESEVPHVVIDTGEASWSKPTARWSASAPEEASWSGMRHVLLDEEGRFRMRVGDSEHVVDIGADLASTHVTLLLMGLHVFITVPETGALVRELHLDPERDFRPE